MTQQLLFPVLPQTKLLSDCKKGDKFRYHGRTWEYLQQVRHPMNSAHNQIMVKNLQTGQFSYIDEMFTTVEFLNT